MPLTCSATLGEDVAITAGALTTSSSLLAATICAISEGLKEMGTAFGKLEGEKVRQPPGGACAIFSSVSSSSSCAYFSFL